MRKTMRWSEGALCLGLLVGCGEAQLTEPLQVEMAGTDVQSVTPTIGVLSPPIRSLSPSFTEPTGADVGEADSDDAGADEVLGDFEGRLVLSSSEYLALGGEPCAETLWLLPEFRSGVLDLAGCLRPEAEVHSDLHRGLPLRLFREPDAETPEPQVALEGGAPSRRTEEFAAPAGRFSGKLRGWNRTEGRSAG
ncbi:MAG: hypothetical protein AAGF12_23075 [Myxococcota bacterium]